MKVAVVGGGLWGLGLAAAALRSGAPTTLVSRRTQGDLPAGLASASDLAAVRDARFVVLAVPSGVAGAVLDDLGPHLDGTHYVLHGIRGLVGEELATVSDLVRSHTAARRVGALGGPALADDLVAGRPSVLVAASRYPELTELASELLGSSAVRVYPTRDLVGLEWASALVGCLSIALGYARGLGTSPGLVAALTTRAVGEAARLVAAAGGDERTMLGLAGFGDLLAAIEQNDRPEVRLGRALAKGLSLDAAVAEARLRVEAIELVPRVVAWAEGRGVRAPIFRALAKGVVEGRKADALLSELMTLPVEHGA